MPNIHRRPISSFAGPFAAFAVAVGLLVGSAPPASAASVTIRITNRLEPAEITVAAGTTVRWFNGDDGRHRMRSQSGPDEFDSGNLAPGESFAVTLRVTGSYTYLDERADDDARYHGRIVVTSTDDGSGGGGTTGGGTTAASATVGMAGRAFTPSTVTIAAGASVTFRNDDDDEHTATATGGAFNSGTLNPGESFEQSFPKAGTFDYLCALHSDMTGTVVVKAAGGAAPAPAPKPTPKPSPTPTPAAPGDPAPATAEVEARDFAFAPALLRIAAGTTVTWRNVGQAPHTVTADDGSFDSEMIPAGGTFERTFEAAGTFAYMCAFHPDMTGVVEVTAGGSAPRPVPPTSPTPDAAASATAEPRATRTASTEPRPTASSTVEPDLVAAGGGSGASPAAAGSQAPSRVIRLPDGDALLRLGFAAFIVVAGAILFGRTIRSSVRPAAE